MTIDEDKRLSSKSIYDHEVAEELSYSIELELFGLDAFEVKLKKDF
jgi:hypothetical protein